jgi:hypothetical protein
MRKAAGFFGIIICLMMVASTSHGIDMTSWYTDGASRSGPVTVVARATHSLGITTLGLRVLYSNSAMLANRGPLRAYIRVNGRQAVVPLIPPVDPLCTWNVVLSSGLNSCGQWGVSDDSPWCRPLLDRIHGLFFYAVNSDHMNALDIQVAVVNGQGQWDSNNGENYRMRIGPLF